MKVKESVSRKIFSVFNYLFLGLLSLSCLLPLINLFAISFSARSMVDANAVSFWPKGFNTAAYEYILSNKQYFQSFAITLGRVILGWAVNLVLIILVAYPLSKDDPRKFFYIKDYRYRSYDSSPMSLAKITISVLGLNDSDEKVLPRFLIGNKLIEELGILYEDAFELGYNIITDTRKRNRIISGCSNLLKMCVRSSRFGATMATVLHESDDYNKLRDLLFKYGFWRDELEKLHRESLSISLSKN